MVNFRSPGRPTELRVGVCAASAAARRDGTLRPERPAGTNNRPAVGHCSCLWLMLCPNRNFHTRTRTRDAHTIGLRARPIGLAFDYRRNPVRCGQRVPGTELTARANTTGCTGLSTNGRLRFPFPPRRAGHPRPHGPAAPRSLPAPRPAAPAAPLIPKAMLIR